MTHEHHHHERTVTSLNKAFILGIALNVAFVVVEFAVGLSYGSMGLLSDAGRRRRLRPATPMVTRKARC